MIEGIPKISVLVITYNQENVISRALDSLVTQKDYLYEICVSDDCSKDRTWDILQEYSAKYPGLFVLNRNDPNLGIFENVEKTWAMPSGDLIYQLAGDDECGKGWFRKVVEFIRDSKIDYQNELFCIYGDFKCVYPNGDSFIKRNYRVISGLNPIGLYIREQISNRSACYSVNILNKFLKVSQGKSHVAEYAQEVQLQLFSEKNYYISFVGNVYYTRIGINVHLDEKLLKERENVDDYTREFLEQHGYIYDRKDINYIKYKNVVSRKFRNKSLLYNFKILYSFFWGNDLIWGKNKINIRRYLFAVVRRVPHKKPLLWVLD